MTDWLLDPHRMRQHAGWTPARVTLVQMLALAAPIAVKLVEQGTAMAAVLVTALVTSLVWDLAFALIRGRTPSWHSLSTALIITVLIPSTLPLWQVAMAASFGMVFGELVFGGRGYGIVPAAAAAAGFLVFSFSGAELSSSNQAMALATLPGAVLLLAGGLVSWRVLVPVVAVLAVAGFAQGDISGFFETLIAVAFGMVFLIGDPVAAASTNLGRWVYGALAGLLIVVFDTLAGPAVAPAAIVFASLLASLFAPLIDYAAVAVILRRRRQAHG
ncbi:Na+-transporting NADH:ubiquinone oxidoreductase, subunit NqrB [Hoeflea sp. IMCC20628]|uniref:RnfABCDGE type electron transport complex subunit D n=1 Tax=Hoeflea sp. IMCC20628 TaxID=1620421 RepID=UPI00063BE810|nr:RnfABCDGE type electron transport complex subunit D [Hoeflea sp. IMCC20628]AKH98993.1 Na+-transporting NADH:ubiquinone oxidoreductase, subunit NqrB [Hoeflea sp. IMCC20628]